MRKSLIISALIAATATLGACSQEAQQKTEDAADAAGKDLEAAAGVASQEASEAAANADEALDKVGDKIEQKRAEVEAEAQDESTAAAKAD
ncbi:MAG TPA: hypothetical protein VJM34_04305 [Novosphingobium sp.]|nr:hypothetical protein [Novosphingobium sp.]